MSLIPVWPAVMEHFAPCGQPLNCLLSGFRTMHTHQRLIASLLDRFSRTNDD
jgi:hypothetical protein